MASYELALVRGKWPGGIFMPANCIKERGGGTVTLKRENLMLICTSIQSVCIGD